MVKVVSVDLTVTGLTPRGATAVTGGGAQDVDGPSRASHPARPDEAGQAVMDVLAELGREFRGREAFRVACDHRCDAGHQAVGPRLPGGASSLDQHPLHESIPVLLGELRQLLTAESAAYRFQVLAAALQ
ncbi:hypothetical protein ACFXPR_35875 [Nocardia tengchongensis]|uniref:hypothetical protein n=1 Tax=Nocardia tengchongensis TaxID=2055889 RepID=UPI003690832F